MYSVCSGKCWTTGSKEKHVGHFEPFLAPLKKCHSALSVPLFPATAAVNARIHLLKSRIVSEKTVIKTFTANYSTAYCAYVPLFTTGICHKHSDGMVTGSELVPLKDFATTI
jgi:hypothetical protein